MDDDPSGHLECADLVLIEFEVVEEAGHLDEFMDQRECCLQLIEFAINADDGRRMNLCFAKLVIEVGDDDLNEVWSDPDDGGRFDHWGGLSR